jgi:hypothetical protein
VLPSRIVQTTHPISVLAATVIQGACLLDGKQHVQAPLRRKRDCSQVYGTNWVAKRERVGYTL